MKKLLLILFILPVFLSAQTIYTGDGTINANRVVTLTPTSTLKFQYSTVRYMYFQPNQFTIAGSQPHLYFIDSADPTHPGYIYQNGGDMYYISYRNASFLATNINFVGSGYIQMTTPVFSITGDLNASHLSGNGSTTTYCCLDPHISGVSISGNSVKFKITFTTSAALTAGGTLMTVLYGASYPSGSNSPVSIPCADDIFTTHNTSEIWCGNNNTVGFAFGAKLASAGTYTFNFISAN